MIRRALPILAVMLPCVAEGALDYEKDIMPIFEAKCFDCHSEKKVKGGLRLDDPLRFFQRFSKNDVVVPGDWDASYLFVTITRPRDSEHAMPPEDEGDPLTPEEIMAVARWIHEGARIGREKGATGDAEMAPEGILRFKDGMLVTEGSIEEDAEEPVDPPPGPREWTNREGRRIFATFKGLEDGQVHLLLQDGRDAIYPLEKLSEESQAAVRELAGSR